MRIAAVSSGIALVLIAGYVLPPRLIAPVPEHVQAQDARTFARFALEMGWLFANDNPIEGAWARTLRVTDVQAFSPAGEEVIDCSSGVCSPRMLEHGKRFECGMGEHAFMTTDWYVAHVRVHGWAGIPAAHLTVDCAGSTSRQAASREYSIAACEDVVGRSGLV